MGSTGFEPVTSSVSTKRCHQASRPMLVQLRGSNLHPGGVNLWLSPLTSRWQISGNPSLGPDGLRFDPIVSNSSTGLCPLDLFSGSFPWLLGNPDVGVLGPADCISRITGQPGRARAIHGRTSCPVCHLAQQFLIPK